MIENSHDGQLNDSRMGVECRGEKYRQDSVSAV
jgi:hypothetical protein